MVAQADSSIAPRTIHSPELSMWATMVHEAFLDLDRTDETDRYESIQFFLSRQPKRAAYRREVFSLLGLNEAVVQRIVEEKVKVLPEKPAYKKMVRRLDGTKVFSKPDAGEVYKVLPEGTFTRKDAVLRMGGRLRYESMASRFAVLEERGLIVRLNRGTFARSDWLERERDTLIAGLGDEAA
ncbi:MAG: hypothetical protein H6833_13840 [Planctomycetes bacterium]|nr:hypothetical protein [Planctomycetota bacterium]